MNLDNMQNMKQINDSDYWITSDGKVWNNKRKKWLSVYTRSNGYQTVSLGRKNNKYIHRLVAEAFIPNPENKPEVDHINRIRNDNNIENLRWVTKKENDQNRICDTTNANKVSSEKFSKEVEMRNKDNHNILYNTFQSTQMAGEFLGSKNKQANIVKCCNGIYGNAYGYWWCYKGDMKNERC